MGNTQIWVYGLSVYFIFLFVVVTLFSQGGAFSNSDLIISTGQYQFNDYNSTDDQLPTGVTSVSKMGSYWRDIFSFFLWDINYYESDSILMEYFWIIRIFIVWLPLLFLILAIWYSLPTVSS